MEKYNRNVYFLISFSQSSNGKDPVPVGCFVVISYAYLMCRAGYFRHNWFIFVLTHYGQYYFFRRFSGLNLR